MEFEAGLQLSYLPEFVPRHHPGLGILSSPDWTGEFNLALRLAKDGSFVKCRAVHKEPGLSAL